MTTQEYRRPKTIGISISDSPDMKMLGLGNGHLRDAMTEVATYLMSSGEDLAYGGDLRENGFTWTLFELASRYTKQASAFTSPSREDRGLIDDFRRDATNDIFISHSQGDQEFVEQLRRVVNYFAWPVHIRMTNDKLDSLAGEVDNVAVLKFLDMEGDPMTMERRREIPTSEPDDAMWAEGLTAMRRTMQGEIDARILLGGRVDDYKGRMPGVAEEALLSLRSEQPVFLLGGFGGCTRDIAETIGLADTLAGSRPLWQGRPEFEDYGPESLNNSLSVEENRVLAQTPYIDQWLPLLLRGLRRL
jgi:hypothetical protein